MKENEAVERTGGKDGSEMVSEPGNTGNEYSSGCEECEMG